MRLHIDTSRILVRELRAMEAGSIKGIVETIAKFMVDDAGAIIPVDQAMAILDECNYDQLYDLAAQFVDGVQEAKKDAVNPPKPRL